MGEHERRWARSGLALLAAVGTATALRAGPLDRGSVPGNDAERPCPDARPSTSDGGPDLSLLWVDVLGAARFAVPDATRELVSLLGRMGVRATVREGDARSVSAGSEITIVVLPRRSPGARLDPRVMGATHRVREGVRAIWVYAGPIGATLGLDLARQHEWPLPDRREFGIALGRVVLHELVHAITPDRPHVKGGLMAERMGRPLLLASNLMIDPATAEAFRRALASQAAGEAAVATAPSAPGDRAPSAP